MQISGVRSAWTVFIRGGNNYFKGRRAHIKVIRQRVFEFGNITFDQAPPLVERKLSVLRGEAVIVYGNAGWKKTGHGSNKERHLIIPDWRLDTVRETWAYAMGMPNYITDRELSESIPPAYTKFIGEHIKQKLSSRA